MDSPTWMQRKKRLSWVVVAAPQGFFASVSDMWEGPMRASKEQAYFDGDFTDLPYRFERPLGATP